ncbi:TIR domain-containing protein [Verrucomicrobiota bacterium]
MTKRRLFISFQHKDQMKGKGFNLLQYNKNVEVEFTSRHFLDPVKSKDKEYIKQKVREQIAGTSVTVVLIGKDTRNSKWIPWEIECSDKNDNGILAIRLPGAPPLPKTCAVQKALDAFGAETIDWKPDQFADAIERTARGAAKGPKIRVSQVGGSRCARRP